MGGRLIGVELTFSFETLTYGLSQSVAWVYKSNSQRKNRTEWKMRSELEINMMILRPVKKVFSSITSLCFTDCLHWNLVTIRIVLLFSWYKPENRDQCVDMTFWRYSFQFSTSPSYKSQVMVAPWLVLGSISGEERRLISRTAVGNWA